MWLRARGGADAAVAWQIAAVAFMATIVQQSESGLVHELEDGRPFSAAGVKVGDKVASIDGTPTPSLAAAKEALKSAQGEAKIVVGRAVPAEVRRIGYLKLGWPGVDQTCCSQQTS